MDSDPIIKELLAKKLFLDLLENVIGQQLSVKAAKTIFNRFLSIFPSSSPSPEEVLAVTHETYRSCGLSNAKARYVKNIAQSVTDGELAIGSFLDMPDEEIRKQLVKIKGIGDWTADMFLIFSLHRSDVFSIGDLGLRTAIEKLYGIDRNNKKKILELSQTWSPNRTLASRLLWSSLDNA